MSSTTASQEYPDRMTTVESSYNSLRSAIRKLKIRADLFRYLTGLFLWVACVSLLLIGWSPLGGLLRLPVPLRAPLTLIWAGCAVWTGYVFVFKSLVNRTSIERMAFRIEQRHPETQDRLISSLQLWPELQENRYGFSTNFISRVIEEAGASLEKIDKSKILVDDLRKFRNAGMVMLAAIIPLIILISLFPATFADSLNVFVHPFERIGQIIPTEITGVVPGDHTVSPGDTVDIIATVKGPVPPTANLYHKTENGEGEWLALPLSREVKEAGNNGEAVFSAALQNIKKSLDYYVSVGDIESKHYSIKVVQKPIVKSLQLELQYPKYTGLLPQTLGENVGDVIAISGTKVLVKATTSKDTASSFVVFGDESKTRLEVTEPRKLTGSFVIERSGRYFISLTDTEGQSNSDPIGYSINMLADQTPKIRIVQPGQDTRLDENMVIALAIDAEDDYGVAEVTLHYQVEGQEEAHKLSLGAYSNPQIALSLKHVWDLEPLKLFPEDVVSYYVEAADADNISGPNIGRSPVFTARLPSIYELYKLAEDEQDVQESEMTDIRSQQEEVKDRIDDVVEELKKEKELDWAGKKELERSVEMQKQIEEQMKNLSEQVNKTVEKMEKNPLIGEEALQRLQELKNLINEVATEDMKQMMRKLSEAMEQMNPSEQKRDLMAAEFNQEELMEKLDRMIDLFKKMKLQQKLEAATNQAKELVRQQTETLEQTEQLAKSDLSKEDNQTKSGTLADREARTERQTEELQNDLNELASEMKESLPNIGNMLDQITKFSEQQKIPEELQNASSELNKMSPEKSLPFQRNALSKLSQLQSDLEETQSAMQGQDMSEIMTALRGAIRNSLYLSHRHEEIMRETEKFESEAEEILPKEKEIMDALATDEIDLAEGARKVAIQLKELSHNVPAVRPETAWNLERAADGMNRAASAMEDKLPILAQPIQKNTLATLNKAIEDMLKSMDQINAQATPMMTPEDYMEQLEQLADQQCQLNNSTSDASSQRRKQGLTPSLQDMLERMAFEQSLIKESAERLAEKFDQLTDVLGNLGEVAKEMQEVEGELRSGNVDQGTIEKQERILTRLLEYQKSLKKQDFSKKREARTGRDYLVERPDSILPPDATEINKRLDTMRSPTTQEQWPAQYRDQIKMYYKALSNTVR